MARVLEGAVTKDFLEVLAFMQERKFIVGEPSPSMINSAKRVHKSTYSIILWKFRLANLPEHGQSFLDEMASDALQVLPQVVLGFGKTTSLLIRGVVENSLRHIYFSDHPVEYARLNRERKWYVGVDQLLDYMKTHHDFYRTEPEFDAIAQLSSLYSELSTDVHGRTVSDLEMRAALEHIRFDEKLAEKQAKLVTRCSQAVNFLMAIYHRDQMRNLEQADRRLLLRSMPQRAREAWTHHE